MTLSNKLQLYYLLVFGSGLGLLGVGVWSMRKLPVNTYLEFGMSGVIVVLMFVLAFGANRWNISHLRAVARSLANAIFVGTTVGFAVFVFDRSTAVTFLLLIAAYTVTAVWLSLDIIEAQQLHPGSMLDCALVQIVFVLLTGLAIVLIDGHYPPEGWVNISGPS